MVLRPLTPIVRSLCRLHRFHSVGLLSLVVVASCSGLGFYLKRILLQKLRWWMWRVVSDEDMQARNINDEAAAMAAATAVISASSAAAQVACLSQVMLTIQAEEKHQTSNVISTLQAVSVNLTKAELIMRGFLDNMDRAKEVSATNAMPLGCEPSHFGHSSDKRYNLQWQAPSSKANDVSNTRGNSVETPQPTKQDSTFRSPSFLEVMAMLERGETPPGIKKINDKPPIPNQLPSASWLKPKPKPWEMEERACSSSGPEI